MPPRPDAPVPAELPPRKVVGRRDERADLLGRLERLNAFVARLRPPDAPRNPLKDGSWPVRKRAGRPDPR
jgi:hypothetical protein